MTLSDLLDNFKNNNNAYGDFKNYEREISAYKDKLQPMTDEQGNIFRHIAGSSAMTQKYNPFYVNMLGLGKEFEDYFIKHKNGLDSLGDLKNNVKGSVIGQQNKYMPRKSLYDLIYNGYVK